MLWKFNKTSVPLFIIRYNESLLNNSQVIIEFEML